MMPDIPVPDVKAPGVPNVGGAAPAAPQAPQAPAGLPPQAKAPEPSPQKSSSKNDDEEKEDKNQVNNPMDLLKPQKGKKDETQSAAGDQMRLVRQLEDTVSEINNQVTDAVKGLGSKVATGIEHGIQAGIKAVRDYMEKDMGTVSAPTDTQASKSTGPTTSMSAAADTSSVSPAADAQAQISSGNVAVPSAPAAPTPDTAPATPTPEVPGKSL